MVSRPVRTSMELRERLVIPDYPTEERAHDNRVKPTYPTRTTGRCTYSRPTSRIVWPISSKEFSRGMGHRRLREVWALANTDDTIDTGGRLRPMSPTRTGLEGNERISRLVDVQHDLRLKRTRLP